MPSNHEIYMRRCFELAEKGKFEVAPNPKVGCVIVHDNKIIGEGYHQKFGENHAEVNAILSVEQKELFPEASLYVNLEPCSHTGKTPPCANLIIANRIRKVIICNKDPHEKVNGLGIKLLKDHGIEVVSGILEAEGMELNKRFFTFHQKKRPYFILKWAETKDGFISRTKSDISGKNNWISNALSKQLVHLWRTEESGILIGKNTALIDNPFLNSREAIGKSPLKIVIDRNLEIPLNYNLFKEKEPIFIINELKEETIDNIHFIKLEFDVNFLVNLSNVLYKKDVLSVIIEGGSTTLQHFIEQNLWDEARVFTSQKIFLSGLKGPNFTKHATKIESIGDDVLSIYLNSSND